MNNHVTKWFVFFLLLYIRPLYAETNHLYASDIIEKKSLPHQQQSSYGSSWRNGSDRYKYNDYYLNQPMEHRQSVNMQDNISYPSLNNIPPIYHYPVKKQINHFGNRFYEPSTEIDRITMSKNTDEQYKKTYYSNVKYVSDLEPTRRTFKNRNKTMFYEFQNNNGSTKERSSIRYISEPTYNSPKMHSSNSSNMFTSEHMGPIYSDFRPDFNSDGLNNTYGVPYNSLSRFGIFSSQ